MNWELALATLSWTGTREDLRRLARLVGIVKAESAPPRSPARCPLLGK